MLKYKTPCNYNRLFSEYSHKMAIFILELIDFHVALLHLCQANMIIMQIVLVMEISRGLRWLDSTSLRGPGRRMGGINTL